MTMYENYLAHKNGWTKKNHKYKERKKVNGKWRYIYDKAKSKVNNVKTKVVNSTKKTVNNKKSGKVKDFFEDVLDSVKDIVMDTIDDNIVSRTFDKIVDKLFKKDKAQEEKKKEETLIIPQDSTMPDGSVHDNKKHKYIAKIKVNNKWRYFYDQKTLKNFYKRHPEYCPPGAKNLPLKTEPSTPEEDMAVVNKNYNKIEDDSYFAAEEPGYFMNCYDCTLCYDARRRGYDVEAIYDEDGGYNIEIESFYKEKFDWNYADPHDVEEQIDDTYEDNSYGYLNMYWNDGGGHTIIWEKQDGKIVLRDCQSNEMFDMDRYKDFIYMTEFERIDDKTITDNAFKEYLQPANDIDEAKEVVDSVKRDGTIPDEYVVDADRMIIYAKH